MKKVVFRSRSVLETIRIGKRIGTRLQPGDVVALTGQLGAGKTHFIKGLAYGVGVKKPRYLSSPSFTLINEYPGRIPFYHIDLYRLRDAAELTNLGWDDIINSGMLIMVEWPERAGDRMPKNVVNIRLAHDPESDARRILDVDSTVVENACWA